MAIQVKFDKSTLESVAKSKPSTDGTIYFTTDTHQIYIGGQAYGGSSENDETITVDEVISFLENPDDPYELESTIDEINA